MWRGQREGEKKERPRLVCVASLVACACVRCDQMGGCLLCEPSATCVGRMNRRGRAFGVVDGRQQDRPRRARVG